MKLSRLHVVLLSLLLAIIALWITNQQSTTDSEQQNISGDRMDYSWQALNTTIWKVTQDSQAQKTIIQADSFLYKNESKESQFTQPDVMIINQNSNTQVTSQKGHSINDQLITFEKDVAVTQKNIDAQQTTQLTTERLHYNVETNQVFTDQTVLVKQGSSQITGKGLQADLKSLEYEFKSDVKGVYHPKP